MQKCACDALNIYLVYIIVIDAYTIFNEYIIKK